MVMLAKTEPGSAAVLPGEELIWTKGGAEGAIEVHPFVADRLLAIPGDHFFVVNTPVKAAKKAEPKPEAEEPVAEEEAPAVEVEVSAEKPAPKKRSTSKE